MRAPADLDRYLAAQDDGDTYRAALAQLRCGRKTSHWMWFVFPQLAGLGRSAMALRYAVRDLDEARAYVAHPVLGPRLARCCDALLALPGDDPVKVLGEVDALKLRSCLTLFTHAADDGEAARFAGVLAKFYDGEQDPATVALL
ncbi:MAG: DUF1810 domain-containing protein [Actinomycetota bacterium]|nr:DUF1810 domain-containing protein [Actinomycetota bacterium]